MGLGGVSCLSFKALASELGLDTIFPLFLINLSQKFPIPNVKNHTFDGV